MPYRRMHQATFVATIFAAALLAPACTHAQQLDAQFRVLAENWAKVKGWPAPTVSVTVIGQITSANRSQWVARIVDSIAIVDLAPLPNAKLGVPNVLQFHSLASQPDFATIRPQKLRVYQNSQLTAPGKSVFSAHWAFPGLAPFDTLGTADGSRPIFEPVLYLTAEIDRPVVALHHSLITEDVTIPLYNGIVSRLTGGCADVRWRIAIQTDDHCHIVDPAPHIQQLACNGTCDDYTVACAKGEEAYTTKTCPSPPQSPLDCIKYVTEVEYATSGVKVTANLGAGATIGGVKLDAGFTVSGDKAGETGSKESIGQLCADGLCIVDGTVVKPNVAPTPVGGALTVVPIAPTISTMVVGGPAPKGDCFADAACKKLLASGVTPGECLYEHDGQYWMGSDGVCKAIVH